MILVLLAYFPSFDDDENKPLNAAILDGVRSTDSETPTVTIKGKGQFHFDTSTGTFQGNMIFWIINNKILLEKFSNVEFFCRCKYLVLPQATNQIS